MTNLVVKGLATFFSDLKPTIWLKDRCVPRASSDAISIMLRPFLNSAFRDNTTDGQSNLEFIPKLTLSRFSLRENSSCGTEFVKL